MRPETKITLQTELYSFARRVAFPALHDGALLPDQDYVELICARLDQVASGKRLRQVFNLPPGHLKTELCSISFPAWILGHNPSTRVMIVTCSENLAEEIARKLRLVLESSLFQEVFPKTKLARGSAADCMTTAGGGIFARSIEGTLTGRRADIIIVDDPLAIKDAGNLAQIEFVNDTFDTEIVSRLNNQRTQPILVVAHRLHENDLSGHVLQRPGWHKLALSLKAPRTRTYDLGYRKITVGRDDFLRPDAFSERTLRDLRQSCAIFDALYQQDTKGLRLFRIKPEHFVRINAMSLPRLPLVVSVDPSQTDGPSSSHAVIQVWGIIEGSDSYVLIHQWRQRATYTQTCNELVHVIRFYRPCAVLIEKALCGEALIAEAKRSTWLKVKDVSPGGRGKIERLRPHKKVIQSGRIMLHDDAELARVFIEELTHFPHAGSDQVDALTQFLDYMAKHPVLQLPPPQAIVASGLGSQPMFKETPPSADAGAQKGLAVLATSRGTFRA